jgi:CRISPR-associated protein Csx17
VEAILVTETDRLKHYREMLRLTFAAMDASGVKAKGDIEGNGRVQRENKSRLLQAPRNELPEGFLVWLDTACVIEQDAPSFNTLLGSGGGSDGNSHFSDNFMQSLWYVLGDFNEQRTKPPKAVSGLQFNSRAALEEALFGTTDRRTKITDLSPVMFDSARVGGPNSTSGFSGKSASNPWDFILMLEGACLFSGSLGKKTGANMQAFARFPFLVESTTVGLGSPAFSERGRELWLPIWRKPTSLSELAAVFAEARMEKYGRTAMSGLDAFVALAQHGCDRGITRFKRIGLFRGRVGGDNYFTAVDQGRFEVCENPSVSFLRPLDHWLEQFRRAARAEGAPSSVQRAARALEAAIIAFCKTADPSRVQELLISLGECEAALAGSWKWTREAYLSSVPLLAPQWLREANTGTVEFRLAAALAAVTSVQGKRALPLSSEEFS